MEVQIREVEDQIKKTSEEVGALYALEETDKARFESKSVQDKINYLMRKEEALRKKEEDLRKKELLLLEISRTLAPPGIYITLPQVLPLSSSTFT